MPPATLDDVVDRLDLLIKLVRLSNADAIESAREVILGDEVSDEIYDRTHDWSSAGPLVAEVVGVTNVASRTVNRRLAELMAKGVLETSGASTSLRYRHIPQF